MSTRQRKQLRHAQANAQRAYDRARMVAESEWNALAVEHNDVARVNQAMADANAITPRGRELWCAWVQSCAE